MNEPRIAPELQGFLRRVVTAGASDLHLSPGQPPTLRLHGLLQPIPGSEPLAADRLDLLAASLLGPAQMEAFARDMALDLAISSEGQRYRVNLFRAQGRTAIAIRRLEPAIKSLEDLKLPPALARLTELQDGLVLVTGATGSGKSTTLATLLDLINQAEPCHILTLEDPIEYLHTSKRSLVRQRELVTDFPEFAAALRVALREDPDVILVGEMRDAETMRTALMAAETGHLVFSTLHSGSAIGATERIVGAFQAGEQDSIRHQLSLVLKAVVTQRLLLGRGGEGRVPVVELLFVTHAVANLIRTGRIAQIQSVMEGGATQGMQTLEQALAEAVLAGRIDEASATTQARDPQVFAERVKQLRASRAPTNRVGGAPWR